METTQQTHTVGDEGQADLTVAQMREFIATLRCLLESHLGESQHIRRIRASPLSKLGTLSHSLGEVTQAAECYEQALTIHHTIHQW